MINIMNWPMVAGQIKEVALWIVAIFGCFGAVYKAVKFLKGNGMFKYLQAIREMPDSLNLIVQKLDRINKEVRIISEVSRASIDELGAGFFMADEKGVWQWCNNNIVSMTERPMTELVGMGWYNTVEMKHRKDVMKEWVSAVHEKRNFECNFLITAKGGSNLLVKMQARPMLGRADESICYGFTGIIKPIL